MDDAYIARPCNTHTIKLTVSLNAIDFFIKILRKRNTKSSIVSGNQMLFKQNIKVFKNLYYIFMQSFIPCEKRMLCFLP